MIQDLTMEEGWFCAQWTISALSLMFLIIILLNNRVNSNFFILYFLENQNALSSLHHAFWKCFLKRTCSITHPLQCYKIFSYLNVVTANLFALISQSSELVKVSAEFITRKMCTFLTWENTFFFANITR